MATYDLRNTIPSASQIAAGDILIAPYSELPNGNVPPYSLTLPKGIFKLEVWGASAFESPGGRGGYAVGTLTLLENTLTYVVPGRIGIGLNESGAQHINGGNGIGGDASDIRLLSNTLNNRIIVAGGGGGAGATGVSGGVLAGGYGGGVAGGDGTSRSGTSNAGKGGTATAGGAGGTTAGTWGNGGNPNGGGGWYGGGSSYVINIQALNFSGAGGGSGFTLTSSSVSNVPSSYASALKNSKYYLSNAQLIAGNASMPKPDGTGSETGHNGSGYAKITVISITPKMTPVTNLKVSGLTANSATLTWTASTVAGASYKVYRGNTLLGTVTTTTYTDTGISPGGTYQYKVVATRDGYTDSDAVTVSVTNLSQLSTPTAGTTTYTESATTITWNAVTNATAYKVWRGTTLLTSTNTTRSYTDTSAGAGKSYTYYVAATASGYYESAQRSISTTNNPKLATPVLSASYTLTSTTISWGAVSGTNVKYKVWRGSTYIGEQTTRSYTDSTAGAGTSYTYKVVATGSNAYDSKQASINTSNNGQLATPTAKTTTYTESSTTISWNAVANATAYKVYRGTTLLTSTLTATTYTDSTSYAGAGKSNTYKVSATASGYYESAQLSISTANPSKLATPTGLAVTLTATSTTITWNAVTNATAYKVWRDSTLLTSTNTSRSYTDTSGGAGTSHTYYVAATASGYYQSAQASIASTNKQQFATPTNLAVTYTKTSTTISWSKVTSPASATVYNVWRGSTSLGTITSSAATISYTDSSSYGASGKSNTYYVTAAATSSYYESAKASIKTSNPATLGTPQNLAATYTKTQTTISWSAVTSATSYKIHRGTSSSFTPSTSNLVSTQSGTSYVDANAGSGTSYTYKVIASNSPTYYDSAAASVTSHNPSTLATPTITGATQTVSSVTITWNAVTNATGYVYRRVHNGTSSGPYTVNTNRLVDNTTQPGETYTYYVSATANGYWQSAEAAQIVGVYSRFPTPSIAEASQTQTSVTLSITVASNASGTLVLSRNGTQIATQALSNPSTLWQYTDSGLTSKQSYVYTVYVASSSPSQYDSLVATLTVYVGKDYTSIERQRSYLAALKRPFLKLCRLRFLYPNGATAFALDNNPVNRRSKAFVQSGSVNANMQNGQRLTASVTIANANQEFDFNINKIWFGQEVALDEGLILPNGEEYWRQTGVFVIDNPQETINPNNKTVTYNLVDKWADLDGTLDGNLEGTYEVAVNTNIFNPIASLLSEGRGNGRPVDRVAPVFTNYFNSKTQKLPDGSTVSMVLSPYTLTIDGDGGTIGAVILGLSGMVNAWVGYDNTGRLRIEPSQDDIIDAQKAVLYTFTPEEVTLLGMSYTIKKEDLFNDYIVVGEQMDDYSQPGGRAENFDPRSDTNINIIGRKTKRESASGYATVTQCKDLAEWRLKRSGVLQKAVNFSCSQMFHIELNALVEIVRTDKPGAPTERHLIQGYSRPLATSGAMTITAVSVNDFPIATVSEWPLAT
jgi:hypothetical protein